MPTPNAELARRVLEHIEAHPETWRQAFWATRTECGTAYCFAGHVVALHDPAAVFEFKRDTIGDITADNVLTADVQSRSIRALAMELLGLNTYSGDVLFEGTNTFEHLAEYVRQLSDPSFTSDDDLVCVNLRMSNGDDYEDDDEYQYEDYEP